MSNSDLNRYLFPITIAIWLFHLLIHFTEVADPILGIISIIIALIVHIFPSVRNFSNQSWFDLPFTTAFLSVLCVVGLYFSLQGVFFTGSQTSIAINPTATTEINTPTYVSTPTSDFATVTSNLTTTPEIQATPQAMQQTDTAETPTLVGLTTITAKERLNIKNSYRLGWKMVLMSIGKDLYSPEELQIETRKIQELIDYLEIDFQYSEISVDDRINNAITIGQIILDKIDVKYERKSGVPQAFLLASRFFSTSSSVSHVNPSIDWGKMALQDFPVFYTVPTRIRIHIK